MDKKLLVIIPAYNEEQNILKVINEIKTDLAFADLLVINDCSTDETEKVLIENDINYINNPINLGYSGTVQTGFKYAVNNNYDYVLQFDGDGQHIANEAKRLFDEAQKQDADVVIGSRFVKNTEYNHSFFRKLGTNLFVFLIRLICKTVITDPTSGLQVINKRTFTKYSKLNGYPEYPDANLIIEMLLRGYKIFEIDVQMRSREFGVSMHSGIIKPIKYMINMVYTILLLVFRKKDFRKAS